MNVAGRLFACAPAGRVMRPGLMRYGIVSEKIVPAAKLQGSAKTSHAPVAANTANDGTPNRRQTRTPAAHPTTAKRIECSRFFASKTVLIGVGERNNN